MPDASQLFPIPLIPGIREDADRATLPTGSLVSAANARTRKGGIGKANGLTTAGLTKQGGGSLSGTFDALGFAAGREVAVNGGRAYARQNFTDPWQEVGRASRARPVKAHWGAFTDATSGVAQPACATIGAYIARAYYDGAGVRVAVTDPSGIVRAAGFFTGRFLPRIFAVGTKLVLTTHQIGGVGIFGATIDGTTLAISGETLITGTQTSTDTYDAAPFNSTLFLVAGRSGAVAFTVSLVDLSFGTTASQGVTIANNDVTATSVYGTDGENIFATLVQAAANVQQIAAFAEDLSSTIFAATTYSASASVVPGVMTRRNATSVWLVFEESFAAPTRTRLQLRAYDTVLGYITAATAYAWHVRPASRPWGGTTTALSMWLHTDGGIAAWATNRRYTLATFSIDTDVPSSFGAFIEPELSPDERSNAQQSFHVPEVAFRTTIDEAGSPVQRAYFPALSTIRTQNDSVLGGAALVIYEWEPALGFAARHRRVAELGGEGVIFGGGLQELPSARISPLGIDTEARGSENGFLFAPAILTATKTATGADGLTADVLYKFVAIFEYITPDGLRTRSAPSNIASETPTAGLLNVQLEISTAPTTEREFSSPPNQAVVHIYATTGGTDTFQRITPDSGLSAGIGTNAVGIITYVHSAADATYASNEPAYTEGAKANQPAPAHRFGWIGGGRAWVGGLFNQQVIECGKLSAQNEPAQFTRDNAFRCLLPEPTTGGAFLDGNNIVFSATGVYLVPGTGPDNAGNPGVGVAQKLPSSVGCIDWRSVVELPDGIGFQSQRGYELLPRGYGEPQLLSLPVQETLRGRRIISAAVVVSSGSTFSQASRLGERRLFLTAIDPELAADPGVRLVLDIDSGRWLSSDPAMSESSTNGELVTAWEGKLVIASCNGGAFRREDLTAWSAAALSITTGDERLFGVIGRFQAHRLQLLGEIRSSSKISATLFQDGAYSKPIPLEPVFIVGTAGDKFLAEWVFPFRECNAVGVSLTVTDTNGASTGENLVLHSLGIEATGLAGRPRVVQTRSA